MAAPSTSAASAAASAASSSSSSAPSSGTSAAPAYASASLYVGDLLPEVTEALLFETFNAVGPVASVRVCRDSATRRSLGYAYVNFHRVDDAERALDAMNFKPIRGRPARIMWSHRDPSLRKSGAGNIFVKNLARTIDNKQLYDTFSVFGNILSCKVATNAKGASLGYGFVHYESDEAAANAIAKVDGKVIAHEKVSVAAFKSKKERGGTAKHARFTNLYVKCLPPDFTDEKLVALFSKYGTVTSHMLHFDKESKRPPKKAPAAAGGAGAESKAAAPTPTAPEGYGFVNFQAPEEATAALDALNNFEIVPGQKLYVARAQKREEREKELREKFEQLKIERAKKYAGVNLYVKNLGDDVDDERLRAEFGRFGSITSARVMRDEATKKSRGFGFVCFSTPEEATKAVTEMNGKMFESKPLYVALAQRKEQRRAQLEARHQARGKMGPGGPHGMAPQHMAFPPQGPVFYNPGAPPRNFMYPPMGGRGGWMGPMGPGPVPMGRAPMAYQLMPVAGNGARPGDRPMPAGPGAVPRGAAGPRPGAPAGGDRAAAAAARGAQPAGAPAGAPRGGAPAGGPRPGAPAGPTVGAGGAAYNLSGNVRNPQAQGRPAMPAPSAEAPEPAIAAATSATAPLTIKTLAAAPEKQKKQMIGEQLFPLIKAREPALAGKITGMLLEMDNVELIHLLESSGALTEKINEAMAVLQAHEQSQGDEEEGTEE